MLGHTCEGTPKRAPDKPYSVIASSLQSPTPAYYVPARINNVSVSCLVDTGAAVTLIREEVWNKIACGDTLESWTGQTLIGVEGAPLRVLGTKEVNLVLCSGESESSVCHEVFCETFGCKVVVVGDLTADLILGLDFLQKNKCVLNLGQRKLQFPDSGFSVQLDKNLVSHLTEIRVTLGVNVCLPAYSEMEVMARVPVSVQGGSWILEGLSGEQKPIVPARALVSPRNGEVPVRLCNTGSVPATIYKGTRIATLESVESPLVEAAVGVSETPQTLVTKEKSDLIWACVQDIGDHLSSTEQHLLYDLLHGYHDVISSGSHDVGRTSKIRHEIHTGDAPPIRQPVRRIPPARREEVRGLLKDMLERDVIQPSSGPWAAPIVLVQKKDGTTRFCVDYRKLNNVTRKDAYPLPCIDDTLDTLVGSNWFSTLDLVSGYWQVEMSEADREKTGFCTPEGLFEFKVMPFGLCNAPATFQRLMNMVLAGLQWTNCLVYLDDVIVPGKSFEDHLQNLGYVLERFRQAGLKIKLSKCSLCQLQVSFLGHIVSKEGVAADPDKTKQVANWPTPSSKREVQQFLGLANYYRRFVKDYATIAKPLHHLTEKDCEFVWTEECQAAFDKLRNSLVTSPILAFPDLSKPFILDTDASDTGIGAVLSQKHNDGTERVIAYASRVLSKPERRYCVTRRELLAVVFFTKHFRPYLFGQKFILRTDHGSLTWLRNFKEPEGQTARWIERLQEYDFTIVHRPGKKHGNADALSRLPCRQCGRDSHDSNFSSISAVSLYD